jgi:GR25 family glycosyltransferase involved in LPS biosynthesis
MKNPIDLSAWLSHHRNMGVSHFYIRLEDTDESVAFYIESQEDCTLERGESEKDNYQTLMARQVRFVSSSLVSSSASEMDFLFAIDSDELLSGSLTFLDSLPDSISTLSIENAEAVYDGTQKKCFDSNKFRRCDLKSQCRSYINGKAGGRVRSGVKPEGPHDFSYLGSLKKGNMKVPFSVLHVLHYDSCSFEAWAGKFINIQDSKNVIPFPYYRESIDAVRNAKKIYEKNTRQDEDEDIEIIEHYDSEDHQVSLKPLRPWLNFMRVICINLDKNDERWLSVKTSYSESDLYSYNVKMRRFSAYVGKDLELEKMMSPEGIAELLQVERKGYRTHHYQMTRGAVGCFMSHWEVYLELLNDSDNDSYLVLEDDALVNPRIASKLAQLSVPGDWDLILLDVTRMRDPVQSVTHDVSRVHAFWGTQGYIINKKAAKKICDAFDADPIDAQIDARLSYMIQTQDLKVYALKEKLVMINRVIDFSDIQNPCREASDAYVYRGHDI